jgi:phage-related protein
MFIFNNISSTDMEVIIEEEEHFLGKASQRYVRSEIEGRNGALFEEQGYTVIERPMKVQILNLDKLDKILGWLNGVGILEYKGRITKARFYNEIEPIRTANIKIADVTFIRDPFWNKKRDDFIEVTNIILNEGNIYAEPIIKLKRNKLDKIDITINDVRFIYNFNNEEYVDIDCEEQIVEYEKNNRNRQIEIGYKFPTIKPGENKIIVHSGDARIFIKRKDRWL